MLAVCGQHRARYDETGLCPLQPVSQAQFPTNIFKRKVMSTTTLKKTLANLGKLIYLKRFQYLWNEKHTCQKQKKTIPLTHKNLASGLCGANSLAKTW